MLTEQSIGAGKMKITKWVKGGIIAAAVTGAAMSASFAQEVSESHLEAARKAITAIQATERFDDILPGVALRITSQLIANNPDLEPQINEVVDQETLALVSRRADLEREAALVYAKSISEEDLNAIAEFYSSSAGQALLTNGAILAREVQQSAAVWQRGVERDLMENVNAKLKEVAPRPETEQTGDAAEPKAE
jgi:hypothetical protein